MWKKVALVAVVGTWVALVSAAVTPQEADAGQPCARTEFKTRSVKQACEKGGQAAAKKAMRTFMKDAKKRSGEKIRCKSCHTKSSGDYPLTKDGLSLYKKWGGK